MPNVSTLPALCLYILLEELVAVAFPGSFKFLAIYLWPLYSKVPCGWTVNQFVLTKTSPSPSFPAYLNLALLIVFVFCSFSIFTVTNKCKLNNLKLQNFYSYSRGGQKSTVKAREGLYSFWEALGKFLFWDWQGLMFGGTQPARFFFILRKFHKPTIDFLQTWERPFRLPTLS